MRNKYILIAVVLLTLAFGVGRLSAGTPDSPSAPGATNSFTLEDIYNRLNAGTAGSQSTFTEPAAGPGTGTMHTLNEIMAKAPAADNTNGAVPGEVLTGKTYWGLRTDGTWGPRTGSAAAGSNVNGPDGSKTFNIPDGFYSGKTVTANDADLVAGNIKQGVNIFGVPGSAIAATGNATAGDVLTGKTFSNASAAGIAGTMPDKEGDNASTSRSAAGGVNYFTAPQGYYDGDDRVSATDAQVAALDADITAGNIKSGVIIFGVAGTLKPGALAKRVAKTGQTTCYDSGGAVIACAGTGQDGEYQMGINPAIAPTYGPSGAYNTPAWTGVRFTDNGDGTVTDNLTALIWLKNANCFGVRSWATALSDANTLASPSCGLSDGSSASAWRLPNVNELHSLIDHTHSYPALPAGHPFTGVQSDVYWASTTSAGDSSRAWGVFLVDGGVGYDGKAGSYYVWPVRGGQ